MKKLLNLCALVTVDYECFLCSLPSADALLIVGASSPFLYRKKKKEYVVVGYFYATIISKGSSDTWCSDTYKSKNDDRYHSMDESWSKPPKCNLLNLHLDFNLDCKIDGEWNF